MRLAAVAGVAISALALGGAGSQGVSLAGDVVYMYEGPVTPFSLWVADPTDGAIRRLPLGKRTAAHPHWSADGRRIVFLRASGIWIAQTRARDGDLSGSFSQRRILPRSGASDIAWSPDASTLVLTRGDHRRRFCTDLYT